MPPPTPPTAPSRRQFLRVGTSLLALPWLESLAIGAPAGLRPRRIVAICNNFGFYAPAFFPKEPGEHYTPSEYLEIMGDLRSKFTVFSGISHPNIGGDHASEACFLTSAQRPTAPGFRNTVSLDFLAAQQMGGATRFPLLSLETGEGAGASLTYTASGATVPSLRKPSEVFGRLFLAGKPKEVEAELARMQEGRSLLDRMGERFSDLGRRLSERDRQQVADYTEAVRELEKQLQANEAWATRPKPTVEEEPPVDSDNRADIIGRSRLMFKMIRLALQTDSTRVISLAIRGQDSRPPIEGVEEAHHNLSHHGNDPIKIEQLKAIERAQMRAVRDFLADLDATPDGAGTLLDATQVLLGSNLGDASWHGTSNLPVILAGGGWKHGRHVAGDRKNNTPLGKLFVSMLQRFGVETDAFGSGRGTIDGLV
jgi:hypothetical protein